MLNDDDEPGRPRPAMRPLDRLGIAELQAYIAELQGEIARAQAEIVRKQAVQSAAHGFFKAP